MGTVESSQVGDNELATFSSTLLRGVSDVSNSVPRPSALAAAAAARSYFHLYKSHK